MLAHVERANLAERLLADTITAQGVERDQLTIHADRGAAMASKPVALLLADLGVTKTHSRPQVSNDNPYSESQFKTLKYRPEFPKRFGSIEDARSFTKNFFAWYNNEHRHSGIGYHTPNRRALRPSRNHPDPTSRRPRRRLPDPSRTVRPQTANTATAPTDSVDQQTRGGHPDPMKQ
jgi:transposase InsO family protein